MPDRPNFVIFYTDDQRNGDLSCMGSSDWRPRILTLLPPLAPSCGAGTELPGAHRHGPPC